MNAKLFEFNIRDFEEVYAVVDSEKQRLHISPVNYSYNITLDLTKDLNEEIEKQTRFRGEVGFNKRVRQAAENIIKELKL
jgi:hypothetical protein